MGAVQLISLSCNHCGAPLEAAADTRFLTCAHCDTRLAVRHTDSSHFTQVLEQLDARMDSVERSVRILQLESELSRFDSEWNQLHASPLAETEERGPAVRLPEGSPAPTIIFAVLVSALISVPGFYFGPIAGAFGILVSAIERRTGSFFAQEGAPIRDFRATPAGSRSRELAQRRGERRGREVPSLVSLFLLRALCASA